MHLGSTALSRETKAFSQEVKGNQSETKLHMTPSEYTLMNFETLEGKLSTVLTWFPGMLELALALQ
jgi:hypothetical protein